MIHKAKSSLINYYYLIVALVYFSTIYMPFIRLGLLMSSIMILGIFILYKNKDFRLRKGLDMFVLAYLMYNLFSFVFFSFSGLPISVFYREFSNSILPIIPFYFFGRLNHQNSFYKITLYALVFCFVVGFYFKFTLPMNYMKFLDNMESSGTNPLGYITNFRSILGLSATGALGAIGLLISLDVLYKSKFKTGKVIFLICFVALVLSFRRAALYTGIFAILWMNYLMLFKLKGSKLKLLIFELLIVFLFLYNLLDSNPDFLFDLYERFNSLSDAIDERSDSWITGLSNTQNFIVGDGLGRYGHKAVEFSDMYIPDGNYFRMIAEIGIIGVSIFFIIIINALYNGFSNIKTHYIQLAVIIMVCMMSVGSDMFSFQLVAPIFWFSIGACSKFNTQHIKSNLILQK